MSAGNCWELALEGEKLCKSGYCEEGVQLFEAAIQLGTSDEHLLSAVYSQLGNAYICLQNYQKALEYHRLDLNVARLIFIILDTLHSILFALYSVTFSHTVCFSNCCVVVEK